MAISYIFSHGLAIDCRSVVGFQNLPRPRSGKRPKLPQQGFFLAQTGKPAYAPAQHRGYLADKSHVAHPPYRRSRATLPSQCIWLASSFGACNEMPEVPARKHCYGEVLRGMCCCAAPKL